MEVLPPLPLDARTSLFRDGLQQIRQMTGLPDARARALLGKLLKTCNDNAATVSAVVAEAHDLRPAEPVAWLMRAAQMRRSNHAWMFEPDAVERSASLAAQSQYAWCIPDLLNGQRH